MLNFQKIVCLLLTCIVSIAFSSLALADNASDTLTKYLRNMHSLKANFTQTVMDKKGKAVQKSTGHMSLQRPNQFRWDITNPNHQLIVTNGKKLWIYDPDLEQVTIRNLVKTAGETPAMLLSDETLALGDDFTVHTADKPTSKLQWFTLIPKDKGNVISSMKLGFLNQQIQQMHLHDHLGHTTIIEFKNAVLNSSLSNSLFNFKPPARVDIIDETKTKH